MFTQGKLGNARDFTYNPILIFGRVALCTLGKLIDVYRQRREDVLTFWPIIWYWSEFLRCLLPSHFSDCTSFPCEGAWGFCSYILFFFCLWIPTTHFHTKTLQILLGKSSAFWVICGMTHKSSWGERELFAQSGEFSTQNGWILPK